MYHGFGTPFAQLRVERSGPTTGISGFGSRDLGELDPAHWPYYATRFGAYIHYRNISLDPAITLYYGLSIKGTRTQIKGTKGVLDGTIPGFYIGGGVLGTRLYKGLRV